MGRPRLSNQDFPKRLQFRRGKYYYTAGGQWLPLGADLEVAKAAAERLNLANAEASQAAFAVARDVCAELREIVMVRDAYKCVYCGATENLEIDHVIPASKGGASSLRNLVVACASCNMVKSDGDLAEFLVRLHRVVERCLAAAGVPSE